MSVRTLIAALALMGGPMAAPAAAQSVPPPAAELSLGWVGFPDDGEIVNETMVGGTVRWYLTRQVSVGPEVVYIKGPGHSHLMVTGNIMWDVVPSRGGSRLLTPYLVAGGGVFQTRDRFPSGTFKSNEGAFTAGGGLRFKAEGPLIVGAEARVGWELHLRVNGFIGLQF